VTEVDQNLNQFTVEYLITELGEGGAQYQKQSLPPANAPPKLVEFATPQIAD